MTTENNKRIAKNTLFLYFRSILTLGVGLYTSREVLAQLGVSDFGIYNVVGGVIVLFGFIQSAMNSATSRFFTYDLGIGDQEKLRKTFNLSVVIHLFTALVILILGETIGLWFMNTQLVIPPERMEVANFVYQFSILSCCVGILQVPFMVAITAHERMKIFAYAGIAEVMLKLAVALALGFALFDKLKFYAVLLFAVYLIMGVFYAVYSWRSFKETHFKWFWDRKMFWERMGFSSFEFVGGISVVLATQAGIILINRFYGVLLNAANGVYQQIINASSLFTHNFLAATTPQITKYMAAGSMDLFDDLVIRASKFCFLLCFIFMAPVAIQMDFVLQIWLKEVPDYAGILCQLGIINILVCSVAAPIWQAIIATGKNKRFRLIDSILIMLIFPLTILGLHFSPIGYICAHIFINIFRVYYAIISLHRLTGFPIRRMLEQSLFKCLIAGIISVPLPFYISLKISGWVGFLVCLTVFLVVFAVCALFIGLNRNERKSILGFVFNKMSAIIRLFSN